ncbi:class I SAM-dependent methyltransferase [Sphingobacterium sp. HJSM2_6]|uniref:class I SAM-dependent methyltransferase n=1 Tax=Sphingobacterium sp. HJSM2_6 TaxID=3366264 RepID=UPI003BCC623F
MINKSTIQEIKARFDQDVERFSNLETGQATSIDASLNMEWICTAISKVQPDVSAVLDIGCGAGNYDVKLLEKLNPIDFTLLDLSMPMLIRAKQRIDQINLGKTTCLQGDFRTIPLADNHFDVIIATAVLHHLRDDQDWELAFEKLHRCLKPGGSIWIFDLIQQSNSVLQKYMYDELYGQFLTNLKDEAYRDHVFDYIEKEDSPRPLLYQLDLLKKVGFKEVDILSKNLCFASFVAFK